MVLAGLALTYPEKVIDWHGRFVARLSDDQLRTAAPDEPWSVLMHVIADDPGPLWDFLQRELLQIREFGGDGS
jgi:hypothetical protein